jgi:hypothetical protein
MRRALEVLAATLLVSCLAASAAGEGAAPADAAISWKFDTGG